jgi:hypothetical protein
LAGRDILLFLRQLSEVLRVRIEFRVKTAGRDQFQHYLKEEWRSIRPLGSSAEDYSGEDFETASRSDSFCSLPKATR